MINKYKRNSFDFIKHKNYCSIINSQQKMQKFTLNLLNNHGLQKNILHFHNKHNKMMKFKTEMSITI